MEQIVKKFNLFLFSKLFMERGETATNSPLGSPERRQVVSATVTRVELNNIGTPVTFTLPNPEVQIYSSSISSFE